MAKVKLTRKWTIEVDDHVVGSFRRRGRSQCYGCEYEVTIGPKIMLVTGRAEIGNAVLRALEKDVTILRPLVEGLTPEERALLRRLPGRGQTLVLDTLASKQLNPGGWRVADLWMDAGGARRYADLIYLRWHVWTGMRQLIGADGKPWSYPRIAQCFGCDHTTVMHGVRRYAAGATPQRTKRAA